MGIRRFTDEQEAEIARRYVAGESSCQLAAQYGVSKPCILGALSRQKVTIRPPRKFTDEQEAEIALRYLAGESTPKLAAQYRVRPNVILEALGRNGTPRRSAVDARMLHPPRQRKLTEVQESEIAQRYEGGESTPQLAESFNASSHCIALALGRSGVSLRSLSEVRKLQPHPRKLTDDQEAEIACRYQAGETPDQLASQYQVGAACILEGLRRNGIETRSIRAAKLWSYGKFPDVSVAVAIAEISKQRLFELYCLDRKSITEVSDCIGVGRSAARGLLQHHGIPIRSRSEQQKLDYKRGKRISPWKGKPKTERQLAASMASLSAAHAANLGVPLSKERRKKLSVARTKRVEVFCEWCGAAKSIRPCKLGSVNYCNPECGSRGPHFARKHGPDTRRPLIVEKLIALVPAKYYHSRIRNERTGLWDPYTEKQITDAGAELGARKPEIDAVLEALSESEPQPIQTARAQGMDLAILR